MTIRERQSRAFELLQQFERQARRINSMPFGIERDQAESLFVLKFMRETKETLFERPPRVRARTCSECDGIGRLAGVRCANCSGSGVIITREAPSV